MVDPAATIPVPTIVNTPPVVPVAPETKMFPTTPETPPSETPPVEPPTVPPVIPPVVPTEPPKPPTEPVKAEVPATPPAAPTDITLKLPEGSLLSADQLAQTVKEAKDAGMSQIQADVLVKSKDQSAKESVKAFETRQNEVFAQTKVQWKEAVSKDPELGGEHLAETALLASRGFSAIANPTLQKLADETGIGSHPEFVRAMVKVGRLIGEDRLVPGTTASPAVKQEPWEKMFGKTTPGADGKRPT